MAKQLSMEELVKKYQYVRGNQQITSGKESNSKSNDKDHLDFSKFSISSNAPSSSSNDSTAASPADACKVCLDAEANCAFIECGHIASCLNCAKLLSKCPICRETIKRTLRVYKS